GAVAAKPRGLRHRPGAHDDLLLADPQHPRERPVAGDHHSVAARSRKPVRPGGNDVLLNRGGYRSFSRWMSTRNDRDAAISLFLRRPSRSATGFGRRITRTIRTVATPSRKPPVAAATAAGSDTGGRLSIGRASARTG